MPDPVPTQPKPAIQSLEGQLTAVLSAVAAVVTLLAATGRIKGDPTDITTQIMSLAVPLTALVGATVAIWQLIRSRTSLKEAHVDAGKPVVVVEPPAPTVPPFRPTN